MQSIVVSSTGYARLSPHMARAVLAAFALLALLGVAITLSPLKSGFADAPDRGPGDLALYRAEVERIRAGEGYYEAANDELRARGYPTRSVFNWRTPLPMWLIGRLPHPLLGRLLLGGLALAAVYLSFTWVAREGTVWQGIGCGLAMIGAVLPCFFSGLIVAPELWSAALITLSLVAYGQQRLCLAALLGCTALFFRDLAAPYCLLMGGLALWHRRRGELAVWMSGLAGYALFFGLHVAAVAELVGPNDRAHRESWIQFGGLPFVLSTCQMNAYLLLRPQWVTAVYFALSLLGLSGWHTAAGQRVGLTVALYVGTFAVVGHPFNQYWGALFAPLLCFGVARCPASLRDLLRAAAIFSPLTVGVPGKSSG